MSFSETTVAAVEAWADSLPLVNTQETAARLRKATAELSRLQADLALHFDLLEIVRPLVHYVASRLDRNDPTTTGKPVKSKSLQKNLCKGYEKVLVAALDAKARTLRRNLLASAAHRVFSEMGQIALRCYQSYEPLPRSYWSRCHHYFKKIEARELLDFRLTDDDEDNRPMRLEEVYLRNLLFVSSKPNQLKQTDLPNVYSALKEWSRHASLEPASSDAFLLVDLDANSGPQYSKKATHLSNPRTLRTDVLTYEIEAFLNDVNSKLPVPEYLDLKLLTHLSQAWSVIHPREFRRVPTDTRMRVCVGIPSTHYFLSGGIEFNEQIANSDPFLRREINPFIDIDFTPRTSSSPNDPWNRVRMIPENPNVQNPDRILLKSDARIERAYNHYELRAIDTSPGGYKLMWRNELPASIRVGNLVALREEEDSRWCVATIRWLARDGDQSLMGVQLLSPKAIPVAIRPIQKRGSTIGFSRGLLLPGIDAIGQATTMITPRMPFSEGQKVSVQRQGIQTTGLLMEIQSFTESFNQFTFRVLDGYLENSAGASNMQDLMTREDTTQGP